MQRVITYWKIYRIIRNTLLYMALSIVVLFVIIFFLLKIPAIQNWASQRVTSWLSDKLQTEVTLGSVDIEIFDHLILNELYIEDKQQDTLLYAGRFEVKIGSINPFRPSVRLKNIALEDAYINIYRTLPDSIYNFQFVADAFSSEGSAVTDTTEPVASSPSTFDLHLNRLNIEETRFVMYDEVGHIDLDIFIPESEILINEIDPLGHILALEKIEFQQADIGFTALLDTIPDTEATGYDTVHIALGDWKMEVTRLLLEDCAFYFKDDNSTSQTSGMNFADIGLTHINIDMSEILYAGDTILAAINQISLKDKSGFQVDTLSTGILFSPYEVTCNNLYITTPHSSIHNQFAMTFTTLNDFSRFETDVRFRAEFDEAVISATDIGYFTSGLEGHDEALTISSRISGPLSSLKMRELECDVNGISGIKGDITVRGLPNIDETFVDVELNPLFVNLNQLDQLIGEGTLPEEVKNLGEVYYNGRITGFVYNLVAFGNFATSQGDVETDINFVYDKANKNTHYTGKFNTTQLNVGVISGQPELLGKVSMNANIDGGIINKEPEFKLESTINSIELNDYAYTNIKVNGELKHNSFEGHFEIDDPGLVMNFNGLVDFSDSIPTYDFSSTIYRAYLQKLNLYNEPVIVSARANMKGKGKTIDDMVGKASFDELYIIKGRDVYRLDSFTVNSTYADGKKVITGESDLVDFRFEGDFVLSKLPATVKRLVNYYTTGTDSVAIANQVASFSIRIKNADRLAAIFYPDVKVMRNVDISGDLNSVKNEFNSRIRAEQLEYKSYQFDTLMFETRTVSNTLQFFARINRTYINQSQYIPSTSVEGTFANNDLDYILKIGRDIDSNRLDLHGEFKFEDSLIAMSILPSEIFYNGSKWDILANNSLQILNKTLVAENFTLTSGNQVISLSSAPDSTYRTILKLNIKNIPIDDLAETFVLPGEDVSGNLSGTFRIGDIFSKPSFIGSAEITDLYIGGKEYGKFKFNASQIQPGNKIKINAGLTGQYGFSVDGYYRRAVAGEQDSLNMQLDFSKTPVSLAEPFMRGILSELKGDLYGKLKISGSLDDLGMEGNVRIQKGGLKIDYVGTKYHFDNLQVDIDRSRITIPPQTILDELNNKGTLEGAIGYNNFDNWDFRKLSLVSDHIQLMKTSRSENPDFWGYAIGKVDANITGTLDELTITVNATPTDSVFYLPTYGSGNVKKHDFIRFIDKSAPATTTVTNDQMNLSIVNVDLNLNITPAIEAKILINSEGTEFLTGKGFGNLKIKANTLGKVEIQGDMVISAGVYDFSFQNLFPRRFIVQPGGTIKFDGDPFKAQFDLVASYTAQDVAVSTLTGTTTEAEMDVEVLINITGNLESPVIDFDIAIPENITVGSDVQRSIQQIKSDKNELNKQVFGLLITNNFLPADLTAYNPVGNTVNNTMNEFISGQLTTYFQNVLNDFLKNAEVDVGYKTLQQGDYAYTSKQGQQFEFSIKQEIAKNLIVKVGTTYYDIASGGTAGDASNIGGDFEVEYLITEDGRIRLRAFSVSEYDAIVAKNANKTGVGIYYTKDFDKLSELFQRKKKTTE